MYAQASQAFNAQPLAATRIQSAAPAAPPVVIDGNDLNPGTRSTGGTPDGKAIESDTLDQRGDVSVSRERTIGTYGTQSYVTADRLVFETGAAGDQVRISRNAGGGLSIDVNAQVYDVTLARDQELEIRTTGGDDTVEVAADVDTNIRVQAGAGDDSVSTGAGQDHIDGGPGNDRLDGGAGRDDIFGNSGDDILSGNAGDDVIYGGDGGDQVRGDAGNDYLEGGAGADALSGKLGDDILSGGLGDDRLESDAGNDRVYAGDGHDIIGNEAGADHVYAQTDVDEISAGPQASNEVTQVDYTATLGDSVTLSGSDAFQQRVGADLEFLRSSPNGQVMLGEFDAAAANGNRVSISELQNEDNGFAISRGDTELGPRGPGAGSDAEINFNPGFHESYFEAPVVVLFHEMSHAYNAVSGTFQPGTYQGSDIQDRGINNSERQAVGLDNDGIPFDFDHDPSTPDTTHNPFNLTENGLRDELGLPPREHYAF